MKGALYGVIGPDLASAYRMPARTDVDVFVVSLLQAAGFEATVPEVNEEARKVIIGFAVRLDAETPYPHDPGRPGAAIVDSVLAALWRWVDGDVALKALAGFHPELRVQPGALKRLRPVARAKLREDLRAVAAPILADWARRGRYEDSEGFDDEGIGAKPKELRYDERDLERPPGPARPPPPPKNAPRIGD